MDPNNGKKYPHQFIHQMQYGSNFNNYVPSEYHQIPAPQIPSMTMNSSSLPRVPYVEQPQPQLSYQPVPQPSTVQPTKQKGKRRSKNETEGRDYKCSQCEKTYLSYPALYTHIKTKHSNKGDTPITSVRGRGRPKKNTNKDNYTDPASPFYFHTNERKGGPTAVIYGFKEAYDLLFSNSNKYGGYEKHKLYIELYKRHLENVKICNYTREHPGCKVFGLKPEELQEAIYEIKGEEEPNTEQPERKQGGAVEDQGINEKIREENQKLKKLKKCDEIFAEYLDLVAKDVNKQCYSHVIKFVLLYRECMNYYGNKHNKDKNSVKANFGENEGKDEESKEDYCLVNDAEHVPEVSNEFVSTYLEDVKTSFGDMSSIELTQNFCEWLFNGGYTCSKLSLMADN